MSKRFTDTEKWRDPWFRRLPPHLKLLWLYLCDACDIAGVWVPDLEAASFFVGCDFDPHEALLAFGDRVVALRCGKWHLTKFLAFQYPNGTSANTKPHAAIRAQLAKHGIDPSVSIIGAVASAEAQSTLTRPSMEGPRTFQDTDKDKDTDKDSSARAKTHDDPEIRLAPWVRVGVQDPKREAAHRATLVSLIADYGEKAVQRVAEAFRHREGRKAFPDDLIAPLRNQEHEQRAPRSIDPEGDAIAQAVKRYGWHRCAEAADLTQIERLPSAAAARELTPDDMAIEILRNNRPAARAMLAKLGGQAASGAA